jgi:valyl-tRNA synthetase
VIPPPNVTGSLHIGHMLEHTEIDILTRWHRMRGYNTLYLPGTDHAGISTQRVVVKQLMDQGMDYQKLGREEFEKRVWAWKAEAGGEIVEQMKGIGESCDWSRERFTLSPEMSRVVRKVFVQLYNEGLIYRETRLVNWCPVCLTVLSDLEVNHEERVGQLWTIRYPVAGTNEYVAVATTRPETMLGDTAVAVHPEDMRYTHLVGRKVILPLMNREIPIIADPMVDREFGTGAVKITPAHDPNDFEVGKRHGLGQIDVMTDDGHMNAHAGAYAGLDRFVARKKIVEDLKANGLLEKVAEHTHAIGICERSKTIVEPRISTQWFCAMKGLAAPAIQAVREYEAGKENTIQIVPDNRRQEFLNWLDSIRDWTISRQLWWGHRIPAWYCGACGHIIVAEEVPAKCTNCGGGELKQDPDVLDTWFSSGLWPFSTLGWPEKTSDFRKYYPTSLLITGYDILFFWVARMVMLGIHFTGQVPFRAVYLHSLVRTASGEKMSKSKGTGLDPVALNEQYGTDAMRFCLASMAAPGTDIVLSDDRLLGARSFANKIWNAARFLFVNLEKAGGVATSLDALASPHMRSTAPHWLGGELPLVHRWIFSRLTWTVMTIERALESYKFHEAAQAVYHFFWGDFCDWYVEWTKVELADDRNANYENSWRNIFAVFDSALRLLHPFMPFITEELWHQLPNDQDVKSIALQEYPLVRGDWSDEKAERQFGAIQGIVYETRNIRSDNKIDPKKKLAVEFYTAETALHDYVREYREPIMRLAGLSDLTIAQNRLSPDGGIFRSTLNFDIKIIYTETSDPTAELARLKKEIEGLQKAVASKKKQLENTTFRSRAPHNIISDMEEALARQAVELQKLVQRKQQLESGIGA